MGFRGVHLGPQRTPNFERPPCSSLGALSENDRIQALFPIEGELLSGWSAQIPLDINAKSSLISSFRCSPARELHGGRRKLAVPRWTPWFLRHSACQERCDMDDGFCPKLGLFGVIFFGAGHGVSSGLDLAARVVPWRFERFRRNSSKH